MTTPKKLCNCGTTSDAYEVAAKLATELVEGNCPVWAIQVMTALGQINTMVGAAFVLAPPFSETNKRFMTVMEKQMGQTLADESLLAKRVGELCTHIGTASAMNTMAVGESIGDIINRMEKEVKDGK